jgi:hypothetical protein
MAHLSLFRIGLGLDLDGAAAASSIHFHENLLVFLANSSCKISFEYRPILS